MAVCPAKTSSKPPGLSGRLLTRVTKDLNLKVKIDFAELIFQKQEVVNSYRDKKYQSLVYEEDKIKVFEGKAELVDEHTVRVGEQI
ncbi:MAG: hypothetical protein M0C28_30595 [Candidatus Moduliflexus flocculans]|nr:hypothetical protein [Candidatus Moduliflexus flocculans]